MTNRTQLTEMQENFCHEYVANNGNGKEAAIAVGASSRSATVTASKWLALTKVKDRISELKTESIQRCQIDADWIILRLKMIADRGMEETENRFTVDAALRALRELIKIGGYYTPTQAVSSNINNHRITNNYENLGHTLDEFEKKLTEYEKPF